MNKLTKKFSFLIIIYSFFFVNGIVYILDKQLGYLNIVHSVMLQKIESAYKNEEVIYKNDADSVVVLLSNKIFEKEFNSQTPLNKEKLALLVESIFKLNPKSVVFDLDLSPDYNFQKQTQEQTTNLYELLKSYSKNIKIVLPFAFIADTKENKILKYNWAKQICEGNIQFAFPFITDEIGSVLQYSQDQNHITLFANNFIQNKHTATVCDDVIQGVSTDFQHIIDNYYKKYQISKKIPINYQKINNSTIILDNLSDLKNYNLKDKIVFLGGGYGFGDKHITPFGEKYGVEVLNSIYYTLNHKIDEASVLTTLILLDLLIGLSFGFFINKLLKYRENITKQSYLSINNFMLIITMIIYFIISVYVSTYTFHNMFIWLNPVPLIIGMFIDSIIGLGDKKVNNKDNLIVIIYIIKSFFVIVGVYALFDSI